MPPNRATPLLPTWDYNPMGLFPFAAPGRTCLMIAAVVRVESYNGSLSF